MSASSDNRNFRVPGKRMTAIAMRRLGRRDYTMIVAQALRNVTSGVQSAAKLIAGAANSNVRSAENWMSARTLPNAYYLDALREAFPELEAEIRRLRGLEGEGEPIARQIDAIVNMAVRLRANHENLARENRGANAALPRPPSTVARRESGEVGISARPIGKSGTDTTT